MHNTDIYNTRTS